MVYTRWRTAGGVFPFSPYSRPAHINGSNFVGTDVCLSPRAHELFDPTDILGSLRNMAEQGLTFHGVNAVTYERRGNGASS